MVGAWREEKILFVFNQSWAIGRRQSYDNLHFGIAHILVNRKYAKSVLVFSIRSAFIGSIREYYVHGDESLFHATASM